MPKSISINQLQKVGTSTEMLKLFKSLYGDALEVDRRVLAQHSTAFSFTYLARMLLSYPQFHRYIFECAAIHERWETRVAASFKKYHEACVMARLIKNVAGSSEEALQRKELRFHGLHVERVRKLQDKYCADRARLFADLYNSDHVLSPLTEEVE
jgi:hypothetical protein